MNVYRLTFADGSNLVDWFVVAPSVAAAVARTARPGFACQITQVLQVNPPSARVVLADDRPGAGG